MNISEFVAAFAARPTRGNAELLADLLDQEGDGRADVVRVFANRPEGERRAMILRVMAAAPVEGAYP